MYATNGAALAVITPLDAGRGRCRTCSAWRCWAVSRATFRAIPASWSRKRNYLSWAVLKAHTDNRAGEVTLRSADPRDPPLVNFHYFEEGSDAAGEDLEPWSSGIRFVRRMTGAAERRAA